jgi:uncharacterized protein (TIGR04255 family)
MAARTEIFKNSTVKQVVFEIRYANLFYIESKIGDIQLELMEMFPETALLFRRQIVFSASGSQPHKHSGEEEAPDAKKIWSFKNDRGFELNISSDSLNITSSLHKTYDKEGGERFRDIIWLVVDTFLRHVNLPVINRIGFRYIDECPLPERKNEKFIELFNSCLPVERFPIEESAEMDFKTVVKVGNYFLRYVESLQVVGDRNFLILDFDGFANHIKSADFLKVTDELHEIICAEFYRTLKKPFLEYMRGNHEMG